MKILIETRSHHADTVDLCHTDFWPARKAMGSVSNRDRSELRCLQATARTFDCRDEDLELAHWRKVRRSLVED